MRSRTRRLHRRRGQPGTRHRRRGRAPPRACAGRCRPRRPPAARAAELRREGAGCADRRARDDHPRPREGMRIDEPEIDRAVQSIAAQNQITHAVLRERLRRRRHRTTGASAPTCATRCMIERLREREVYQRIKISRRGHRPPSWPQQRDAAIGRRRHQHRADPGHGAGRRRACRPPLAARAVAEAALARVRKGEAFDAVAREVSEDGNKRRTVARSACARHRACPTSSSRRPCARSRRGQVATSCCAPAPASTC